MERLANSRLFFFLLALTIADGAMQTALAGENLVEVMLVETLDEPRGYCLDIAGGKGKRAPLNKGLQAHTCYHYTGVVLEDQGFDAVLISKGQFRIAYFDVCMQADAVQSGAKISLGSCTDVEKQKFELTASGQLVTRTNPNLCVTVDNMKKREGRGGSPKHVMRPLTLETCDKAKKAYQRWTTR